MTESSQEDFRLVGAHANSHEFIAMVMKSGEKKRTPNAFTMQNLFSKFDIRPNEATVLYALACDKNALLNTSRDPYFRDKVRIATQIMLRAYHNVRLPPPNQKQQLLKQ